MILVLQLTEKCPKILCGILKKLKNYGKIMKKLSYFFFNLVAQKMFFFFIEQIHRNPFVCVVPNKCVSFLKYIQDPKLLHVSAKTLIDEFRVNASRTERWGSVV